VFSCSRVIFVAAQERYIPFARFFGKLHPTLHTPVNALALNWCWTAVLFVIMAVFLSVFPFFPPPGGRSGPIPFYLSALMGCLFILVTIPLWWVMIIHHGSAASAWESAKGWARCGKGGKRDTVVWARKHGGGGGGSGSGGGEVLERTQSWDLHGV